MLIGDVAQGEMGADNYSAMIRKPNGHPGAGMRYLAGTGGKCAADGRPSSRRRSPKSARTCRTGYSYAFANDTSDFIKLSIWEVVKTLMEAILLVVLVMFVFLQELAGDS